MSNAMQQVGLMPIVVGGLADDSPMGYLVREIGGNSNLIRGWLSSTFEDPCLEAAYQKDRQRALQIRGRNVATITGITLTVFTVMIVAANDFNGPTFFFMAVFLSVALACFLLRLCFLVNPATASKAYDIVMFFSGFVILSLGALTRDRVARMLSLSDDDGSHTTTLMEASSILATTAAVAITCSLMHLPSRLTFLMTVLGLGANFGLAMGFGSMEWERMNEVRAVSGGMQGTFYFDYTVLAVKQFICSLMIWMGSRYNEELWRQTFSWAYFAVAKADQEQERNRALWQRLDEVTRTDNLIRHALRPAKTQEGAKKSAIDRRRESSMVPCPTEVEDVRSSAWKVSASNAAAKPNAILVRAMTGRRTSWDRVCKIATSISLPEYSLRQFLSDCLTCFPELSLYFLEADSTASGGRLNSTEYQRTIGALFAVYWLLRLEVDGRVGFVYGVDEDWNVVEPKDMPEASGKEFLKMRESERKAHFLQRINWSVFANVVKCAGCAPPASDSLETTVALLCLTAFHDIMKIEALLPTVQEEHGPYAGFAVGVKILDHDIALAYVLEHYPDLLPSFAVLPRAQQRSVLFTQGKLRFNHGWFVQAEAPPGALLSDFKQALSAGVSSEDIGLYFLHWITDLAGADATPLAGAEKLTVGFPHDVLVSFLTSIPILSRLVQTSETQLVEEYYQQRWTKLCKVDPVPTGTDAVARMRLVIMAQNCQVMQAYDQLPVIDRDILTTELSRTGIAGQRYTTYTASGGPAILVYYGPALLQRAAGNIHDLLNALQVLCETLRRARDLWHCAPDLASGNVTVQIGELKSRPIADVVCMSGRFWVLLRRNDLEATVESRRASDLNCLLDGGQAFRLLDFSFANGDTDQNSHMSIMPGGRP